MIAGCISSAAGLNNIYLLSLSYQNTSSGVDPWQLNQNLTTIFSNTTGNAQLEVRTGYQSMCIRQNGGAWFCSTSAGDLVDLIKMEGPSLEIR
jgi:Ca2+ regulator and membrane fusion protein Fig1